MKIEEIEFLIEELLDRQLITTLFLTLNRKDLKEIKNSVNKKVEHYKQGLEDEINPSIAGYESFYQEESEL